MRGLWGRSRRERDDTPGHSRTRPEHDVDTALIIEAARHVVTTRVATQASLARHLFVAPIMADELLARLEHCEVVGPATPGPSRRVLATSAELPGIIAEFERREETGD
ncbi:hypothetical protein C8E83_1867 [Frondihabitans australicus]|uniref:FtsK-like protein n=2 Tax=Frondihabitans australicus TaxID=386892 RepID=A0A495IH13_9MICO|nr:hypothetical protein C8E83_1867 [Frondihabitans australicus]